MDFSIDLKLDKDFTTQLDTSSVSMAQICPSSTALQTNS